jgi:hypothetical protein
MDRYYRLSVRRDPSHAVASHGWSQCGIALHPPSPSKSRRTSAQERDTLIHLRKLPIIMAASVAALAIAGCAAAEQDTGSTAAARDDAEPATAMVAMDGKDIDKATLTRTRKPGTLKDSTFLSGDKEARQQLTFTNTYCFWNDGKVYVSATFVNGLDAHVTVDVQPNYRLKNAGLHGDGLGAQIGVGIDAGATREWVGEAGRPEGLAEGKTPAITECSPEINSVDLG